MIANMGQLHQQMFLVWGWILRAVPRVEINLVMHMRTEKNLSTDILMVAEEEDDWIRIHFSPQIPACILDLDNNLMTSANYNLARPGRPCGAVTGTLRGRCPVTDLAVLVTVAL
jgi:hypothetical protein